MSSVVSTAVAEKPGFSSQPAPSRRAEALAERLEQGARKLAGLAATLTDAEWQMRLPKDGRKIGVIVHHVASQYTLEIKPAANGRLRMPMGLGTESEGSTLG